FAPIRELGRMLRAGETTPTELAEYFLERLDTVGRRFNAVVTLTRERALEEARVAERELAAGHDRGPLHGIPYGAKDLLATGGGSSSGSGSAVGAGAVPFAIGSETWGSITTPSSYCGIAGLRPTYGRVSRRGAMALCWTLDKLGPMCRTADDCGLVLDAIAGH